MPGVDAVCRLDNRLPRLCPTEQLTPSHPRMAACSGSDVSGTSVLSLSQTLQSFCPPPIWGFTYTWAGDQKGFTPMQLCACVPCSRHPNPESHV